MAFPIETKPLPWLAAAFLALALPACDSDEESGDDLEKNASVTGDPSSEDAGVPPSSGTEDQTPTDPETPPSGDPTSPTDPETPPSEDPDDPTDPEKPDDPPPEEPDGSEHLKACYVPERFDDAPFSQGVQFDVQKQNGFIYRYGVYASGVLADGYQQELSIEYFPDPQNVLFISGFPYDLSKEFSYATCEHCVLLYGWAETSTPDKYLRKLYMAESGGIIYSEKPGENGLRGYLLSVTFVEVEIDEETNATTRVPNGCTSYLPRFDFAYTR